MANSVFPISLAFLHADVPVVGALSYAKVKYLSPALLLDFGTFFWALRCC
jgi:hypothetical protein